MNVIRECYLQLFGQYGAQLFDLATVQQAHSLCQQAFQHCHLAQTQLAPPKTGLARVRGKRPVFIPSGMVVGACYMFDTTL